MVTRDNVLVALINPNLTLEGRLLTMLVQYVYTKKTSRMIVQLFDVSSLKYLQTNAQVCLVQPVDAYAFHSEAMWDKCGVGRTRTRPRYAIAGISCMAAKMFASCPAKARGATSVLATPPWRRCAALVRRPRRSTA